VLALYVAFLFAVLGSACIFRLFGTFALVAEIGTKMLAGLTIATFYFRYWHKVWESHKGHNESVIDRDNARYDFLNGFNMEENEVKKKAGKQYSNPAVMGIVYLIAPMGVGIGMILFRSQQHNLAFGLMATLSFPVALGFLKPFTSLFYIYHKLIDYEKRIGKPIINGFNE
jgi:hypothetical protein